MRSFFTSLLIGSLALLKGAQAQVCGVPAERIFRQSLDRASWSLENNAVNPALQLVVGETYQWFNIDYSTQPMYIKTQAGTGTGNQYSRGSDLIGQGTDIITFRPDASLVGTTLYYQSANTASMSGTIQFVTPQSCGATSTPTTHAPTTAAQATTAAATTVTPTTAAATTMAPTTMAPTTMSSAPTVPVLTNGGWADLGCRADSASSRVLANRLTGAVASRAGCQAAAVAANFTYFGVQFGNECWAANTLLNLGTSNLCTVPCAADNSVTCGGGFAMQVFHFSVKPTVSLIRTSAGVGVFVASNATSTIDVTAPVLTLASGSTRTLIPVYAPFSASGPAAATSATLFLGCNNAACTTHTSVVYLCIDLESCSYVGTHGYFTVPLLNGAISTRALLVVASYEAGVTVPLTVSHFNTADPTGLIGCYNDFPRNFVQLANSGSMTPTLCRTQAGAAGYLYAAVQYGFECWASNVVPNTRAADQSVCNINCAGDASIKCGGNYVANVYFVTIGSGVIITAAPSTAAPTTVAPTTVTPTNLPSTSAGGYVGCFADYPRNFNQLASSGSNTPTECRNKARAAGYLYTAVQYGFECWGGNNLPATAATTCDVNCPGNTAIKCGGSYTASVYLTN